MAARGDEGLWKAQENDYDAIILDIMLPGMNGYQICGTLRAEGNTTPILMLTAKDGSYDEAEGLDTGADDYLTKPFEWVVLLARLRVLLRRSNTKDASPELTVDDLTLNPATRDVARAGAPIELTPREFSLLRYLMHRKDQVATKDELLDHVWGECEDGDPNVVQVYVGYLRRKVERGSAPPSVIERLPDGVHRVRDGEVQAATIGVGAEEWAIVNDLASDPDGDEYLVALASAPTQTSGLLFLIPAVLTLGAAIPSGAVAAWIVRRSLRRVDQIQTEVQQISSASLGRRLSTREIADPIDRLAHTMNDMLARLEEAHRQQSQFVADASHELRSPVAGLLAQLEVARQYPAQVDLDELLPRLHTETIRTQALIEDLLYLSRLEGDSQPERPSLSLYEAVDIVERQVERIDGERSEVAVALDRSRLALEMGDGDRTLFASEQRLARVIQNLVDNASHHAAGSVNVGLSVDPLGVEQRWFGVSVLDDGPGIPEADRARIFDRFVRLDEARTRDAGGSGLGLAITRQLVAGMSGTIEVLESTESDFPGAHFFVRLPLNAAPWSERHGSAAAYPHVEASPTV